MNVTDFLRGDKKTFFSDKEKECNKITSLDREVWSSRHSENAILGIAVDRGCWAVVGLPCISSNYSHITATHHLCFWTYLNTQPRLRRKNALMWCFWEQFFCMASFYWLGAGIIKLFIEDLFFLGIDLWFGRKIISEANSILPSPIPCRSDPITHDHLP